MKPITKAQRLAVKRIFDRRPIWKGGSSQQLAMNAGWTFVRVEDIIDPVVRAKITNPAVSMVWLHDTYSPIYLESDDIVADYALSERSTYREFRKTVAYGYDCLMVAWNGMWLGIEKDGHTHS